RTGRPAQFARAGPAVPGTDAHGIAAVPAPVRPAGGDLAVAGGGAGEAGRIAAAAGQEGVGQGRQAGAGCAHPPGEVTPALQRCTASSSLSGTSLVTVPATAAGAPAAAWSGATPDSASAAATACARCAPSSASASGGSACA